MGKSTHTYVWEDTMREEPSVAITTTIPVSAYKEIKDKGWKYNQLIYLGIQYQKEFPALREQLTKLQADYKESDACNERLYRLVKRLEGDLDDTKASINGLVQK